MKQALISKADQLARAYSKTRLYDRQLVGMLGVYLGMGDGIRDVIESDMELRVALDCLQDGSVLEFMLWLQNRETGGHDE